MLKRWIAIGFVCTAVSAPFCRAEIAFKNGVSLSAGIPHPINLGYERRQTETWTGAISLGTLPLHLKNSIDIGISNLDVRARYHPFDGAFFLGAILGSQSVYARTAQAITVSGVGDVPVALDLKIQSVFLTPHLGWLWFFNSGFTFGLEAGIQRPFGSKTQLDVAIQDPAYNAVLDLVKMTAAYQTLESDLEKVGNKLGLVPLPYVSLRFALMF